MDATHQLNVSTGNINTPSSSSEATVRVQGNDDHFNNADESHSFPRSIAMLGDGSDSTVVMFATPTSDAARSVLANDKLLGSIFSLFTMRPAFGILTSDVIVKRWRLDLLRTSLACKRLFNPAMRVLWRSLDSWTPLIKLISTVVEDGMKYTTEEVIEESSLSRYFFYSNFVEQFHLNLAPDDMLNWVSPHIFLLINQYSPSGLLPSLKTLSITGSSMIQEPVVNQLYLMDLMIPQQGVSEIIITEIHADVEVIAASFIRIAQRRSPRIVGLTLHGDDTKGATMLNTLKYLLDLERIDLKFFSFDGLGVDRAVQKGPHFGVLNDLRLAGSVTSVYFMLNFMFPDVPLLENLTISLVPSPKHKSQDTNVRQALAKLVGELIQKRRFPLKTLVIESPSHNPEIRLHSDEQMSLYSGLSLWTQLKVLSIPLAQLTFRITSITMPSNESLERLTLEGGAKGSSCKLKLPIPRITLLQQMFPNLKTLAISASLKLDTDLIVQMQQSLSDRTGPTKCYRLEELILLPLATDRTGLWKPASGQGIFAFLRAYQPTESIADLFLLTRYLNDAFPHLKKINVERLYDFMDREWLDGLAAGVKQFQETSRNKESKICPKCHSSW